MTCESLNWTRDCLLIRALEMTEGKLFVNNGLKSNKSCQNRSNNVCHVEEVHTYVCFASDVNDALSLDETCHVTAV